MLLFDEKKTLKERGTPPPTFSNNLKNQMVGKISYYGEADKRRPDRRVNKINNTKQNNEGQSIKQMRRK